MNGGSVRTWFTALVPTLLVLSCLSPPWVGSARPWVGAVEFTEGLRCDMAAPEIAEHASSFPKLQLHRPEGRKDLLVAQKGDTMVRLDLEGLSLKRYQISWTSGLTKQSYHLKTDLCSGQKLVELHIIGDSEDSGAVVILDGHPVGELSTTGIEVLDVPIGTHTLEVRKADLGSWSTELRYNEKSSGYHRLPVPEGSLSLDL